MREQVRGSKREAKGAQRRGGCKQCGGTGFERSAVRVCDAA